MKLRMTRTIDEREQPWMGDDGASVKSVPEGAIVYAYGGYTYGCISPGGIAVSFEQDQTPFFQVPQDAVEQTSAHYLAIIDEIERIRGRNNKNWMDLLRLAFDRAPREAADIVAAIYQEDAAISALAKKLQDTD